MREKSLDFLGYPNYSVTDDGKVFSLDYRHTGKKVELKYRTDKNGYKTITIRKEGKHKTLKIHRLVALAFLPNPDNLPIINHKDENPSNNNISNLEWCDVKYNCNYGTRNERIAETQLNRKDRSKKVKQFTKDGVFVKEYPSMKEVERQTGFYYSHIGKCCNGKRKSAYGYIWRYA